jgi:hypothetical protein
MFTLCNQIAYNNLMVNGVQRDLGNPDKPDQFNSPAGPVVAASYWADEPAGSPGGHLQPNQIDRLENALAYLKCHGIPPSEIIAISPFRAVADGLRNLIPKYPGLRAGTIHTAQGREAQVVILVLGGDPSKPGAPANWASTPNLVNVAASRAKPRRFLQTAEHRVLDRVIIDDTHRHHGLGRARRNHPRPRQQRCSGLSDLRSENAMP